MDYTDAYNSAKNRYNEAVGNVSSLASDIKEYKAERKIIIDKINDLEKKLKDHEDVLEELEDISSRESDSERVYNCVDTATGDAGSGYRNMATINTITAKSFDAAYSDEMADSKRAIDNYYSSLSTAKGIVNGKIVLIKMDLKTERGNLDDKNEQISGAEGRKDYWEGERNSAAASMAYYWPLMQAQEAFS